MYEILVSCQSSDTCTVICKEYEMLFPKKISVIRDFLKAEFQSDEVTDTYDSDRFAQTFTLQSGGRTCLVSVRRQFIDNHSEKEIPAILKRLKIKDAFLDEDVKRVTLSGSGLECEKA